MLIALKRVGNRPGRVEPRAKKLGPQAYPLLTKLRRSARAEIKNYGHPKHVKYSHSNLSHFFAQHRLPKVNADRSVGCALN